MNGSPSLVAPETCFLTTAGEVELPEPGTGETPGAVADLLRAVLRGRDAPAALLALTGRRTDDLFDELAPFSTGPRRPVIAALAARALSPPRIAEVPAADAATLPLPPAPRPTPFATAPAAVQTSWPAPRLAHGAAERSRPASVPPPFVASRPAATVTPLATPPRTATSPAVNGGVDAAPSSELELQRLRARTLDSDAARAAVADADRRRTGLAAVVPRSTGHRRRRDRPRGGVRRAALGAWSQRRDDAQGASSRRLDTGTRPRPQHRRLQPRGRRRPQRSRLRPRRLCRRHPAPRVSAMRPPATSLSAGAAPRDGSAGRSAANKRRSRGGTRPGRRERTAPVAACGDDTGGGRVDCQPAAARAARG